MQIFLFLILVVIVLAAGYLILILTKIKNAKAKQEWMESQEYTTLRIDVPKNNDKKPLSAEQMFASIHGIYSENSLFQNHLSFEIVARDKFIQFYVYVPKHIKDFVEGQIYAQYPAVEIHEVPDYTESVKPTDGINFAVCDLNMTKPDVYPVKFFTDFEVDPLSGITSVMTKLNQGEEVWFQLVMKPVGDEWQEKGNSIVSAVRAGRKPGGVGISSTILGHLKQFSKAFIQQAIQPGVETEESKSEVKLPATVEEALKGIEQKIVKLGFETKIRILSISNDPISAKVRCQSVSAAFKQFNTTNLNGFKVGEIVTNNYDTWKDFSQRSFEDAGNILNIAELASIYHLPHETVETPNIVWSGAKKGEPPANLPFRENISEEVLTVIGMTNFRSTFHEFGIKNDDRRRHIYIVGKSGTGKSTLIENMAVDDVVRGKGVIIVDPHGELADKVISCVPDYRINDVIVFDPADRAYPIGFNLLEHVEDDFKGMVASGFVGIFKKIFGDSWGPRLEHILRNTVLALLDFTESTMLDIPRMLTDNRFRDRVVEKVKDPVIRDFWVNEFAQYDSKFRTEAVSPILNKVGQFLATATIRNIVGQSKSKINIREIMDQKKILIVNLSRGKIGEDNSALLGAMMITKIQLAAMSRADVTADKRADCFLYVDEFQNFATESFATILSEARKYNLCLTMANQYIEQMSEEVRSAVFGNAGTIAAFRVGGADADFLVKEFEPVFDANDMVNLDKYNIYIKLLIDGISSPAFSAKTLPPVQKLTGNVEKIVNQSHEKYSSLRSVIEEKIINRDKEEEALLKAEAEAFKQGGLEALLVKKADHSTVHVASPEKKSDAFGEAPKETGDSLKRESVPERVTSENTENTEDYIKKESKPRVFRYQNIIGDKIYKEQTARGGVKWYVGEEIDLAKQKELGVEVLKDGEKMIELANKVKKSAVNVSHERTEDPKDTDLNKTDSTIKDRETGSKETKKVEDEKSLTPSKEPDVIIQEEKGEKAKETTTKDNKTNIVNHADAKHLTEGEETVL
ncbi:MAG: type IV secretion system DNA-binding domain-containing protein [Patescibacteria group bacterium]